MSTDPNDNQKPVWLVYVRPIGAPQKPWQEYRVAARSAIQADAIVRRMGYEMQTGTAKKVNEQADSILPVKLQPILCTRCGYELSGLTILDASVICPECSFSQPLVAWSHEEASKFDRNHPIMGIFAAIGMLVVVSLTLIILAIFIPYLFQ